MSGLGGLFVSYNVYLDIRNVGLFFQDTEHGCRTRTLNCTQSAHY